MDVNKFIAIWTYWTAINLSACTKIYIVCCIWRKFLLMWTQLYTSPDFNFTRAIPLHATRHRAGRTKSLSFTWQTSSRQDSLFLFPLFVKIIKLKMARTREYGNCHCHAPRGMFATWPLKSWLSFTTCGTTNVSLVSHDVELRNNSRR